MCYLSNYLLTKTRYSLFPPHRRVFLQSIHTWKAWENIYKRTWKIKQRIYKYPIDREKRCHQIQHTHLCPEHPETREYTMYAIYNTYTATDVAEQIHILNSIWNWQRWASPSSEGCYFLPTETKCKNDLLSREKTTTPYTYIFRVRSWQLCSIIQNRMMLPR